MNERSEAGFVSSPFERTRLWLAAEFAVDPDVLARSLAQTHVELTMPIPSPDAEISLAMAATLLLRLDKAAPTLHLATPATRLRAIPRLDPGALSEAIASEHVGLESASRLSISRAEDPVIRLVFGPASASGIAVSSNGWQASIGAATCTQPGNELAAAYAGVVAAVEAIKAMLRAAGIRTHALSPWTGTASLWDYGLPGSPGPSLAAPIDLDGVVLLGCGGIGSAAGWTIALLPVTGTPMLVDDDDIDVTNLNRHLTAGHAETTSGMAKVDALGDLLDTAGATSERRPSRWQNLSPELRANRELVLVSVDHDPTRRDLQLDLPRLILNAGNADTGLYRVTRHDFLHGACLRCIAQADLRPGGPEESFAQRLGLPLAELRPYVDRNEPIPGSLLTRAALTESERAELRGVRARKAIGIVCDSFAPLPELPALSMPPLSAAPGVLLASELVKSRLRSELPLNRDNNMVAAGVLRGPHAKWLSSRQKQDGCECGEPIYQHAYKRLWAK
jgi:hypothetical protein